MRWNHQFNDVLFSNTSLIYSNYNLKIDFDQNTDQRKFIYNAKSGIDDIGLKTDLQFYPSATHHVKTGLMTTYHRFIPQQTKVQQTDALEIQAVQKLRSIENAVYLEDQWDIKKNVNIVSGLRLSHFNYETTNYLKLEPRISVAWNYRAYLGI